MNCGEQRRFTVRKRLSIEASIKSLLSVLVCHANPTLDTFLYHKCDMESSEYFQLEKPSLCCEHFQLERASAVDSSEDLPLERA